MNRRTFLLILVLFMLSLFADAATWYAEYDAAMGAIAAQNWSAAEAKLKTCLQLQPKQGRKVFAYGVRFIRYIPQYYLGVAAFHQGRYQEALNQFEQVQKSGLVVAADFEYGEMMKLQQAASEQLKPKTEENKTPVPAPIVEPPKSELAEPEPRPAEASKPATTTVEEAKPADLQKQRDTATKLDALKSAVSKKDWLLAQNAARQLAALDPENRELLQMQPVIEKGVSDLKIQDVEDRGLLAFFSGDYSQAALLFERAIAVQKDTAESWFYLGCSHAALGLLQGKEGNALLQKAQKEFAQARKLDRKLTYIPELISPRIVELYQQAR